MGKIIICTTFIFVLISCTCTLVKYNRIINVDGNKLFYNEKANIQVEYYGDYVFDKDTKELLTNKFTSLLNKILEKEIISEKDFLTISRTTVEPFWSSCIILKSKNELKDSYLRELGFVLNKKKSSTYFEKKTSLTENHLTIRVYDNNDQWLMINFLNTNKYFSDVELNFICNNLKFGKEFLKYKPSSPLYLGKENLKGLNYLKPLTSLENIKNNFQTTTEKSLYNKALWTFLSFVNEQDSVIYSQKKALSLFLKFEDLYLKDKFSRYSRDSIEVKLKRIAKNNSVVMFNESRLNPAHRLLLSKYLNIFSKEGFKYLLIEDSDIQDSHLNERGYPVDTTSFYSKEPQMANLIRYAHLLGIQIHFIQNNESENLCYEQAEKIFNLKKNDKILVLAEGNNISEKSGRGKRMARYFKEISGVDPFTINQTEYQFSDCSSNEDILFFTADDLLNKTSEINNFDAFIYNKIKLENKIYYFNNTDLINVKIPLNHIDFFENERYLVSVYDIIEFDETKKCIPIYNKIVKSSNKFIDIKIPEGSYVLLVKDIYNSVIYKQNLEVEK